MPYPDYLDKNPKIIFFADFDGTITMEDCCDWLVVTEGYGREKLHQSCQDVLAGKIQYGEASREQLESIKTPFNECVEKLLAHVQLDPFFESFYRWAVSVDIPIIILSGGITEIIRAVLSKLLGSEADSIEVLANNVVLRDGFTSMNEEGGAWRVQFRDDSIYGHDKSRAIKPYADHRDRMKASEKPLLMYAGDGISDLSAAKETELLFAKAGEDLVDYCRKAGIPFTEFKTWEDILQITQDLYYDRKTIRQIVRKGSPGAQL